MASIVFMNGNEDKEKLYIVCPLLMCFKCYSEIQVLEIGTVFDVLQSPLINWCLSWLI